MAHCAPCLWDCAFPKREGKMPYATHANCKCFSILQYDVVQQQQIALFDYVQLNQDYSGLTPKFRCAFFPMLDNETILLFPFVNFSAHFNLDKRHYRGGYRHQSGRVLNIAEESMKYVFILFSSYAPLSDHELCIHGNVSGKPNKEYTLLIYINLLSIGQLYAKS